MPEAADMASGITFLLLSRAAFSQAEVSVCVCASMSMNVWRVCLFSQVREENCLSLSACLPANLIPVFCKPWKYEEF